MHVRYGLIDRDRGIRVLVDARRPWPLSIVRVATQWRIAREGSGVLSARAFSGGRFQSRWARGSIAATVAASSGTVTLELTDLHGDIIATVNPQSDNAASATYTYTEFGTPETGAGTAATYGYLGTAQRSSEALGDSVLMGVRGYSTSTGRFDSPDPAASGDGANTYGYSGANPVSSSDTSGALTVYHGCWWRWWTYYCQADITRSETRSLSNYISYWGWTAAAVVSAFVAVMAGICAIGGPWAGVICGVVWAIGIGYAIDTLDHASSQGHCFGIKVTDLVVGYPINDNSGYCHGNA